MNGISLLSSPILASAEKSPPPNFIQGLLGGPFMMIIVIMVMMYMLWIRPEQKRAKDHREMIKRVKAGDMVVTTSGIHGTVKGVTDKTLTLEIAKNVEVEIERAAIARLRSGAEAAAE